MPKRSREESPTSSTSNDPQTPEPEYLEPKFADRTCHSSKYIHTSGDTAQRRTVMKCSLPPHAETLCFSTFEEFEVHYAKAHAYRCPECRKNFPTEHFLGLHIEEHHDPLADSKKAKGEKTYRCFVEDCDKICMDPHKRRMHLTDKHMFPKASAIAMSNYDFLIVNTGVDKKSSMLKTKHRKSGLAASRSSLHERASEVVVEGDQQMSENAPLASNVSDTTTVGRGLPKETTAADDEVDNLASTMSALKFVPPSVRFGRGGRRGGLSRT